MRIRRALLNDSSKTIVALHNNQWKSLYPLLQEYDIDASSVIPFLRFYQKNKAIADNFLTTAALPMDIQKFLPPLKPLSLRGFMLWERHFMNAKRGLIALAKPKLFTFLKWIMNPEKRPSILKPRSMFYEVPIYYMGNHLQAYFHTESIPFPGYTQWLDFEAEVGFIVVRKMRNATDDEEAAQTIGGALIINDFSARDIQISEFKGSLFGPVVKAKNFATGFSYDVVTADDILSQFDKLTAKIYINDALIAQGTSQRPQYSPVDMIKYASLEETLYPGEILSTGTIPSCCAVEHYPEKDFFLKKRDTVKIVFDQIGSLENTLI